MRHSSKLVCILSFFLTFCGTDKSIKEYRKPIHNNLNKSLVDQTEGLYLGHEHAEMIGSIEEWKVLIKQNPDEIIVPSNKGKGQSYKDLFNSRIENSLSHLSKELNIYPIQTLQLLFPKDFDQVNDIISSIDNTLDILDPAEHSRKIAHEFIDRVYDSGMQESIIAKLFEVPNPINYPSSSYMADNKTKHKVYNQLYIQASSNRQFHIKHASNEQLKEFFTNLRKAETARGFLSNKQNTPYVLSVPQSTQEVHLKGYSDSLTLDSGKKPDILLSFSKNNILNQKFMDKVKKSIKKCGIYCSGIDITGSITELIPNANQKNSIKQNLSSLIVEYGNIKDFTIRLHTLETDSVIFEEFIQYFRYNKKTTIETSIIVGHSVLLSNEKVEDLITLKKNVPNLTLNANFSSAFISATDKNFDSIVESLEKVIKSGIEIKVGLDGLDLFNDKYLSDKLSLDPARRKYFDLLRSLLAFDLFEEAGEHRRTVKDLLGDSDIKKFNETFKEMLPERWPNHNATDFDFKRTQGKYLQKFPVQRKAPRLK